MTSIFIFEWLAWCCAVQNSETEGDRAGRQRSLQQAQGLLPFPDSMQELVTAMHSVCTSHHEITMRAIWSVFLRCFTLQEDGTYRCAGCQTPLYT